MDIYVKNIMTTPAVSIKKETSLKEIKKIFIDNDLHHLPVLEDEIIVGIVTSTDVHVAEIIQLKAFGKVNENELLAHEIMQNKVIAISPEASLQETAGYFTKHKVHALPVINNDDKLIGIITTFDVVKYISEL